MAIAETLEAVHIYIYRKINKTNLCKRSGETMLFMRI